MAVIKTKEIVELVENTWHNFKKVLKIESLLSTFLVNYLTKQFQLMRRIRFT